VISRIYYYGSLLRILVYALPLLTFGIAAYSRFGSLWLVGISNLAPQDYLILLAFTEVVWILAANYFGLSCVAHLF